MSTPDVTGKLTDARKLALPWESRWAVCGGLVDPPDLFPCLELVEIKDPSSMETGSLLLYRKCEGPK